MLAGASSDSANVAPARGEPHHLGMAAAIIILALAVVFACASTFAPEKPKSILLVAALVFSIGAVLMAATGWPPIGK